MGLFGLSKKELVIKLDTKNEYIARLENDLELIEKENIELKIENEKFDKLITPMMQGCFSAEDKLHEIEQSIMIKNDMLDKKKHEIYLKQSEEANLQHKIIELRKELASLMKVKNESKPAFTNLDAYIKKINPMKTKYEFIFDDPVANRLSTKYFKGLEQLEEKYSVLYHLGLVDGSEVQDFISLCKENICDFYKYKEATILYGEVPSHVPAYKRLAMIYEKQGNYKEAIEICIEALVNGISESTKSGTKGRLARLLKKYDGEVSQKVWELLE